MMRTLKIFRTAALVLLFVTGAGAAEYCRVKDGHVTRGGKRVRFWGVNVNRDHVANHKHAAEMVRRIKAMGFNSIRLWPNSHCFWDEKPGSLRNYKKFAKGDESYFDLFDYIVYRCKEEGLLLRMTMLHYFKRSKITAADYDVIPPKPGEKDRRAEWVEMIGELAKINGHFAQAAEIYDDRVKRLRFDFTKWILNHVNPYTGVRYAEEPAIALLEVGNEVYSTRYFLRYYHRTPEIFKECVRAKFNAWLKDKYGATNVLRSAWGGGLADGERIEDGTVRLSADGKPLARQTEARLADVTDWLYEHHRRWMDEYIRFVRAQAPEGVGCNVVPICADTGDEGEPAQLVVAAQSGDFVSEHGYFTGVAPKTSRKENRFAPYWLPEALSPDTGRFARTLCVAVEDKPMIIYETNTITPSEYRAEYPWRLATLAAWQDFDGIFFYRWGALKSRGGDESNEAFADGRQPLFYAGKHSYWSGVLISPDEVLLASMRGAGRMFLGGLLPPAPKPTVFTVGRKRTNTKLAIRNMTYGGTPFRRTMITHGSRFRVDLKWDGDWKADGPIVEKEFGDKVQPSEHILYDKGNARCIVDAPGAKAVFGIAPKAYFFSDKTSVGDFSREFVAFGLVSLDGKPTAQASSLLLTCVSKSHNTGFNLHLDRYKAKPEEYKRSLDVAKVLDPGTAPVVVERVGFTLRLAGAPVRWTAYDFALKKIATGGPDKTITVDGKAPIFYMELTRD